MPTVSTVMAQTLAELGARRLFGLPGGEVLDLIEATRRAGLRFVLTRRETTASFMADAAGQMERQPGICVATLGPGAINMVLGVANAFLDRSPAIAITATLPLSSTRYATHQNVDLNALYAPVTKASWTLDGRNTAATIRRAWRLALEPRPGPVHLALPGDIAGKDDEQTEDPAQIDISVPGPPPPSARDIERVAAELQAARRPVVILGLDLAPYAPSAALPAFVEKLGVPVFVAPKAKGALPEDHQLFFGVCAGVAADHVIVDFFRRADVLLGIGYDPVESNRTWHRSMKLVSIGPVSICSGDYRPHAECVGEVEATLAALCDRSFGPFEWTREELAGLRAEMARTLRPAPDPPAHGAGSAGDGASAEIGRQGVSPYELTRRLRALFPRDTVVTTDVGAVKFVTSQVFTTLEPMTFLQSNGLSSMGFAFPAAMAARMVHPRRPVLCTVGDGGFGMSLAEVETCVREGLAFVTVVYNDSRLSLIQVIQQNKGLPLYGVEYDRVDFAAAARALGAEGLRAGTLAEVASAVEQAMSAGRLTVVDVQVDPTEYLSHTKPCAL
jgi:acetolactate synthase-1/2/3 large subunit